MHLLLAGITIFIAVSSYVEGQRGQQQELPPFLQGASPATVKEFEMLLMKAENMTQNQLDMAINEWISRQDPRIQKAFQLFMKQVKDAQAQGEAAHKAAIAKFSPEAKNADAQLTAIASHPNKTNRQKGEEIQALLMSLPARVRMEIEQAMRG
ncbi:hypothetical protein KIN20_004322 [Parelaphostrongylus tenuis]|uniref:SXP/RAL-2 family protein Ani s 5-like cation-binding domain-containing protein n=1 Tax=Parelaphostrongylus tenuis TaxID=148309 RepID=A0AAD5QED1_PARTN|nr:hypothetical protein KIN20_004322 [Parelaphostrongylus tenuis]